MAATPIAEFDHRGHYRLHAGSRRRARPVAGPRRNRRSAPASSPADAPLAWRKSAPAPDRTAIRRSPGRRAPAFAARPAFRSDGSASGSSTPSIGSLRDARRKSGSPRRRARRDWRRAATANGHRPARETSARRFASVLHRLKADLDLCERKTLRQRLRRAFRAKMSSGPSAALTFTASGAPPRKARRSGSPRRRMARSSSAVSSAQRASALATSGKAAKASSALRPRNLAPPRRSAAKTRCMALFAGAGQRARNRPSRRRPGSRRRPACPDVFRASPRRRATFVSAAGDRAADGGIRRAIRDAS